jgi:hypothetical protein
MVDLLIPVGRRLVMNAGAVPLSMRGKVDGIVRNAADAREIGAAFGRSYRPKKPIMVVGPDARTVILVVGDGTAEAAELEDLAQMALARQEERVRRHGRGIDIDALREKHGEMRREDVDAAARNAFADHARKRQQNQRTMPGRRPG